MDQLTELRPPDFTDVTNGGSFQTNHYWCAWAAG